MIESNDKPEMNQGASPQRKLFLSIALIACLILLGAIVFLAGPWSGLVNESTYVWVGADPRAPQPADRRVLVGQDVDHVVIEDKLYLKVAQQTGGLLIVDRQRHPWTREQLQEIRAENPKYDNQWLDLDVWADQP